MNSNMFCGNASPSSAFSAPSQAYVSDQYQYSQLNQNNFQMLADSMIPQQPPLYSYDHLITGYPTRQDERSQYPIPVPVAPANEPKPTPPRRVRTQYTSHQLITLDNAFIKNRYLCRSYRIKLSEDLNLTEKQIKVWFQNRRMKFKKENKRVELNQRYQNSTNSESSPVSSISPISTSSAPQAQRPTGRLQNSTFSLNPNTFTPNSNFHPAISSHFNPAAYSVGNPGLFHSDPFSRESEYNPDRPILSLQDIQSNPPVLLDASYSFAHVNNVEAPLLAGLTESAQAYDSHPLNSESPPENGLLEL